MAVLLAQLSGLAIFVVGTVALGLALRRNPCAQEAKRLSRVSHLLFWLGLVLPWTVGVFYPGGAAMDRLVGLPALPFPPAARCVIGLPMLVGGIALMQLSINALSRKGRGAPALKLTQTVVDSGIYGAVRNPMALGFYVALLGGATLLRSSFVMLYTLGIVAARAFNLVFFEETELAQRYGEPYERYRAVTPFLVPRPKR